MKIAVYGATGSVGSQVVSEAVQRGHAVTGLSRRDPGPAAEGARFLTGDAADADAARRVAASHDVVVSALGPSRVPGENADAFADIVRGLAAAAGSTRLIVMGGAGSTLVAPGVRLVDTPDFPEAYKAEALAHAHALEVLRATGPELDWTCLSPAPEVGPGERTGKYVSGADELVGVHITFANVAVALVDEIESPTHRRQRFTLAN